ncbi:hypothetical protein BFP72_16605 [Reichenbachiella sp. 5M10]|uniref:DUF4834 family protein n=1 Tax=Reichenbachiella sp. 5M10 TaxID=1889772 RepID=UPI000C14B1A8|nr:DUF4834 family protein [Reichenbachiella sp. 5M10]PIB36907.1 hypothetical protein BFP72_16605 [Reichenbachiella sp. 5M10]
MLKFIVIFFLFFWIVFKLGGFLVRMFFGNMANQSRQNTTQQNYQQRQPSEGNVHIDYVPKQKKGKVDKHDFKGGDYVDYEEV